MPQRITEKDVREVLERNKRVYAALRKLGKASFGELTKEAHLTKPRLSRCLSDFKRWRIVRVLDVGGRKRFLYELTGEALPPTVTYDHRASKEADYDMKRPKVTIHKGTFRPRVWKSE